MTYRILLIDDDPRLHELLSEYLVGHGFSLEHAGDGPRGLADGAVAETKSLSASRSNSLNA